jgi:superkiller protein 3
MTTPDEQIDRISAVFHDEEERTRKRTLWLTLIPIVVGALVVVSAWLGVSRARGELDGIQADLEQAHEDLRRTEQRHGAMLSQIETLRGTKADMEKEIADLEALFEHFEKKLPAEEMREARYMAQGLKAARSREYSEAIEVYQKALDIDEDNPAALNYKWYAYYKNGQYEEAVETLRRAVAMDPHFAEAFYNLGLALWKLEQPDPAIEAIKTAFRLDPGYVERARLDPEFKPIRSSMAQRAAARTSRSDDEARLIKEARAAFERHDYPAAIVAYQQALEFNPENTRLASWLGHALYLEGRYKEAAGTLERAVKVDPEFAEGHYNLGLALWALGERERGVAELERAFVLDPSWKRRAERDPRYQRIQKMLAGKHGSS